VLPLSQTAPNIDFDEFLAGFDTETREYLQELLAGAGEASRTTPKRLRVLKRLTDRPLRPGDRQRTAGAPHQHSRARFTTSAC